MFNLRRGLSEAKKKIQPGEYVSEVVNIRWAPGYVEGKAIEIRYRLSNDSGNDFPFKETFLVDPEHERSAKFFNYLAENGIEDVEEFVGCHERVTVMRDVVNGATFANIVDREFITDGDKITDDTVEI